MSAPLDELGEADRARLQSTPPPQRAAVMKAVLTTERFSDPDWVFERKLDGIRCVAIRSGDGVRLLSRNDLSLNARYPEIAAALEEEPCERFAVDGEVVAFEGARTSFARLAQRAQRHAPVFLYLFDLLWLGGHDVRPLPLRTRKRLLRSALRFRGPVRLTPHRNEAGEALFVGYYRDRKLEYAGKVGTGFDAAALHELGGQLRRLDRSEAPFDDAAAIRERAAHWVKPCLVAQVGFTEWTRHGRLRHPRFLGLRDDKPAREVVREQ